jgi:thioredoxin-like negative regulator of GroEL
MKTLIAAAMVLMAAPLVSADLPASTAEHPEAKLYDPMRNASADVDSALVRAKVSNKRVVVVMGANWCHDSRSLAGWFETPRFKAMLAAKYELVYVDVGQKDRNIDIVRRFGIRSIKGTPTVMILSAQGALLNRKDAPGWRNAASRKADDIYRYFAEQG